MKNVVQSLFLLVVMVLVVACSNTPAETTAPAEESATAVETVVKERSVNTGDNMNLMANLGIEGMTCAMGCAKSIEKNIAQMEGVVSCKVDFEGQTAHVEFENQKVSEDEMVKFIQEHHGGQYKVTSVEVEKPVVTEDNREMEKGEETEEGSDETALNLKTPTITFPNIFDALMRFYQY